jgi:hypothetical protein
MRRLGVRNYEGCGAAIATFEGSTFVGMLAFRIQTILLTAIGWGEIIFL